MKGITDKRGKGNIHPQSRCHQKRRHIRSGRQMVQGPCGKYGGRGGDGTHVQGVLINNDGVANTKLLRRRTRSTVAVEHPR
ncbi:hypothetical protein BDR07DRAFT_1415769, partial [Suillus spraguei]